MDFLLKQIEKRKKLVKFIIAGGLSAFVNFAVLYFLTDIINVWYLASSVVAFILSFFVSFFLQKFWTFEDGSKDIIYRQLSIYLLIALLGLLFNTLFMYLLVDRLKLWYMLAQFFISGFIAICNFIAYKTFVFKKKEFDL